MAPYRASRTGGRSNRDQIDHDVFSGLPVRHWRKQQVTVNTAPPRDPANVTNATNNGWPERPMPKDAHLLTPWNQALLRAARAGKVLQPLTGPAEEDKETGEDDEAEGYTQTGFTVTKWVLVPKHLEGPEREFLAERRKGLPSLYGGASAQTQGSGQMRKTKIRKTDADGTDHVLEALVPEGQAVEGEVLEQETSLSEAPAPGTVVEGVGIVNAEGIVVAGDQVQPTPPRRRPPPPKRKAKGPGRGRKKRVAFAPGAEGTEITQGINGDATVDQIGQTERNVNADGATNDGDVEIGEDSTLQDGDEGSEEEDEGEDGEEGDREDGELSPSPTSTTKSPSREPIVVEDANHQVPTPLVPTPTLPSTVTKEPSSSPDLPLAAGQAVHAQEIPVQPTQTHVELPESQNEHSRIDAEPPTIMIEPAQETIHASVPGLEEIPITDKVTVEDPPQPINANTEAEIPVEHNPLDGLAEPKAPVTTKPTNDSVHFPDGEEDLLGSLERHLDNQG